MGALMGFIVGYLAGVKAGPEGLEELKEAWLTIQKSEEFQGLVAAALGVAQSAVSQGGSALVEQISAISATAANPNESAEAIGLPGGIDLMETVGTLSRNGELQQLLNSGLMLLGTLLEQGRAAAPKNMSGNA